MKDPIVNEAIARMSGQWREHLRERILAKLPPNVRPITGAALARKLDVDANACKRELKSMFDDGLIGRVAMRDFRSKPKYFKRSES